MTSLWRTRAFLLLWSGQTVAQLGSEVSLVALPLTGILTLHAGPAQMGLLGAMGRVPFLLYPVAGVLVDRWRRRPVLITTDLARAALLATVPLAALLHQLRMELLYAVVLTTAVLGVWFDVAYASYLPAIVDREQLVEGNSRLEVSRSAAQIAGPGTGGLLVQLVGAPAVVLGEAVGFCASAISVLAIREVEPPPQAPPDRPSIVAEMREGMRFVLGHPILRLLALAAAAGNLFWAVQLAVYLLFVSREVGVPPAALGILLAAGGPGALAGSVLAGQVLRRLGLGRTLIAALSLFGAFSLLVALVPTRPAIAVPLLLTASFMTALAFQVSAINYVSMRQLIAPPGLLGRVNATFRFVGLGISPLGSLLGGTLGATIGLRPTLLIAGLGLLIAPLALLLSPVRHVKRPEAL